MGIRQIGRHHSCHLFSLIRCRHLECLPLDYHLLNRFLRGETMNPCAKIKARRTELGLTDAEVANRVGLTISSYFAIEHQENEIILYPELQQVKKICDVLKFDLFELLELNCTFCEETEAHVEKFSLPRNELIAIKRKEMGISAAELGDRVGFYESEIESLELNPEHLETWSIDFIKDLAKVISVPIQILLDSKCKKCGKYVRFRKSKSRDVG